MSSRQRRATSAGADRRRRADKVAGQTGRHAGGSIGSAMVMSLVLLLGSAGVANEIARAANETAGTSNEVARTLDESADTTRSRNLSESALVAHLLQRATFGARPEDVEAVLTVGREAWLDRQLHPEQIADPAMEGRLTVFPAASMPPGELYSFYPNPQVLRARLGLNRAGEASSDSLSPAERQRKLRELQREMGVHPPGRMLFDLVGAKLQRAVYSERQLEEVMTDFWFNHFNVFWGKAANRWLVADYERQAIRPHVFGKFEDFLVATASHPAMLVYLDNWQSSVPDSLNPARAQIEARQRQWKRLSPNQQRRFLERRGISAEQAERIRQQAERARNRRRGINENYARELLELHTLGVSGGYTQQDVIEVARAFTGWTIARPGGMGARKLEGFRFRPEMHDPGTKTVLGHEIPGDRGMEDGLEVLHLLAHHPATARHLATQLAEAFVSDDPPQALVDDLAAVFLETDGDLREVTRALFTSEYFLDPVNYRTKLKSPFELVASALRATDADFGPSRALFQQLRALGQLPYMNPVPTGYPQMAEDWATTGAMLQRMNFALALAGGRLDHVHVPEASGARPASNPGGNSTLAEEVDSLLKDLLPGVETQALGEAILTDLNDRAGFQGARRQRVLALALGSPEFQKH